MSNISNNSVNQVISEIKKSSDDFSFIDTLSQAVTNKQFLEGKLQLDSGEKSSYTYIWEALSAIGQDVGETLYSNVLNYIDNVCNIDVCKISALKSMLKAYGIRYTLFDNLGIFPPKIAYLLDLLSVNKKYLRDSSVFNRSFVAMLVSPSIGVAEKVYENVDIDKMLYQYFRNTITVSDDRNNNMPFIGKYQMTADYSYNNAKCSVDLDTGINTCREYTYGPVHKLYYNFDDIGQYPANYNPDECMKQLSVEFDATYKIKKINVPVDAALSAKDEFYYALFECNKNINYYWKDYSKHVLSGTVSSDTDEILGIMFDFEETVNANSYERVSFGPIFGCMHPEILSAKLIPYDENDFDKATQIALLRTQKLSAIVNYQRINALDKISTTEFSFNFENNRNCEINDVIIEDSTYYNFLSSVYYCHLSNMCNMSYIDDKTKNLINSISSEISSYSELVNPIYQSLNVSAEFFPYQSNYNMSAALDNKEFKQQNSIDLRFDEKKIVNDIEVGIDQLDNYEGVERILLENEIETRHQLLSSCSGSNNLSSNYKKNLMQIVFNTTRENYYRKDLVKKYIKFVEQCNYANDSNIFLSTYSLDNNYMLVDKTTNEYVPLLTMISDDSKDGKISVILDNKMLQNVSKFLADFTLYIANIREKLKTQAVRYYMKGTFNLLSFIINEYLIEFSKNNNVLKYIFDEGSQLQKKYISELSSADVKKEDILNELADIKSRLSAHMYVNVNVEEYDDLTEYYNLSSDKTELAQNKELVNARYWEKTHYGSIASDAIQQFYVNTLKSNANLKADQFDDFLNILYDVGADRSYFDPKTEQFVIDGIHENANGSIDNQNKVEQSFMYIGTTAGKQPFYNIKNQTHPSYQVHPYLYNFIKSVNSAYSIENAFRNGLVDDLIAENAQKQFNTNIGKYGQVIDIWKNNAYDFSGYRTTYEDGSHMPTIANGKIVECADYDGMFYPPALEEYIAAYHKYDNLSATINYDKYAGIKELIAEIKQRRGNFYDKYYKHLSLVDNELNVLADRLYEHADAIVEIVSEKQNSTEVYDIYKYATDKFGNAYGLYKNYSLNRVLIQQLNTDDGTLVVDYPVTYALKENTLGQLWIRLKDTPIAFPAFAGRNPVLQKKIKNNNVETHIAWQLANPNESNDKMCYFYDMEFDTTKQVMFLNCWPLNYIVNSTDKNYEHYSSVAKSIDDNAAILKRKEYSMLVVCCLNQERDDLTNETKLFISHDEIQNIDTFPNIYNQLIQKYKSSHGATLYDLTIDNGKLELNSFVGFYKTVQSVDAVYVLKNYEVSKVDSGVVLSQSDKIINKDRFKVLMYRYTLNSIDDTFSHGPYVLNLNTFANGKYSDYDIASPTVRFNYNNDDLVFGFLSYKNAEILATNFVGKNVGKGETVYPQATKGYALPLSPIKETNSFDAFDKYVTIIDAKMLNNDIIYSDINLFNLNSDASYIPQYPGLVGKNMLYKTIKYGNAKSDKYKSVELLGHSKKISDLVSKIDPNANANYDIDMLQKLKDSIPGRVYEDYNINLDEMLYIQSNPQINYGNSKFDKLNAFEWIIPLDKFSLKELSGVDLLLFNNYNAGKNAYYGGSISNLISAAAAGIEVVADNYISSDVVSEIQLSTSTADIYIAGTFNFFDNPVNKSDTNHINNISKIQIEYVNNDITPTDPIEAANTKSKSYLIMRFFKTNKDRRSYINKNTIKAVMYNKFNLRMYEFYHYFDERGIIKYDGEQNYENAFVDIHDLVFDDYTQKLNEYEKSKVEDYSYTSIVSNLVPDPAAPEDAKYDDRFKWQIEEKLVESQRIYLRDISLSSYNYLSDVIILKDKQNISFKYNEEDVFNYQNSMFYYPGYNKIYPSLNTAMFSMSANYVIDTSQLFDQSNLYITQMEDNQTFADKIGNVDIPVEYNETNCLRVYEDYDKDIDDNDPNLLSCVHFVTNDTTREFPLEVIDGKTFISADIKNYADSLDESIVNAQSIGYYGILTESLSSDFEIDKISFEVTKNNTNLKSLLDIYTNYEVMSDGKIRLFFNYYNFMNPPFIEIVNNRQQVKAIDGTYLMLDPGESGLLDIVVQFKAYYGGNLYGIKNGTLMTYKIFNVSDDKPKFVIYKLSEIAKGSLSDRGGINADAVFNMVNQFIDLDDNSNITTDGKIKLKVKFILESVETVAPGSIFKIIYNLNELSFIEMNNAEVPGFLCTVAEDRENESFGHITLTATQAMKMKSIFLNGKTVTHKTTIVTKQIPSYDMSIIDINAKSIDGDNIDFAKANGSVMFGYQMLLRKEEPHEDALVEQERPAGKLPSFIVTRYA